jgi:hypothetical protein
MSTTTKTTLSNAAWTDITPATKTTLIVWALKDTVVKMGTAASPPITDEGLIVYAGEKVDLTNRIGASDFVHAKSVESTGSILVMSA